MLDGMFPGGFPHVPYTCHIASITLMPLTLIGVVTCCLRGSGTEGGRVERGDDLFEIEPQRRSQETSGSPQGAQYPEGLGGGGGQKAKQQSLQLLQAMEGGGGSRSKRFSTGSRGERMKGYWVLWVLQTRVGEFSSFSMKSSCNALVSLEFRV